MINKDSYVLHIDFEQIMKQVEKLRGVNAEYAAEALSIVLDLQEISTRLEPTLNRQAFERDERVLWRRYQQLQEERLSILDCSHEWEDVEEKVKRLDPELAMKIHDAIEELVEHVIVLGETHKAHIDILEIQSTRSMSLTATVLSVVISYLAFWYIFAHDLISGFVSTYGLSSDLEYLLLFLSILPIFAAILWGWRQRIKR